jgi:Dyp-type peroxidase family
MFLSARGYEALELQGSLPEGQAFRAGMGSRQAILSDPPSGQWESHLAGPVHAMILLADDDRNALKARTSDMRSRIESGGAATVVGVDEGIARRNDEKQGIEHFGYVDGRSQPLILEEDIDKERAAGGVDKWDPSIPLKQVLVPCPGAGLDVSHGSFFVFRKLEQDVLGFKTREIALAEELKRQSKSDPGELAGAYVVGRFENGTPTLLESHEVPVGPGATAVPNNFNYDADQAGLSCPYAAHIRKTNPRDPKIDSTSRLMARRGIIYGERKDGPNDGKLNNKPSRGVGLLFMAYQSSLENQFEFTQESWANNKGFHFASPVQPVGIDPVIGQPKSGGDQAYPLKYGVGPLSELFDFSGFVKMQGGEYFFAPSLSFFKRL